MKFETPAAPDDYWFEVKNTDHPKTVRVELWCQKPLTRGMFRVDHGLIAVDLYGEKGVYQRAQVMLDKLKEREQTT